MNSDVGRVGLARSWIDPQHPRVLRTNVSSRVRSLPEKGRVLCWLFMIGVSAALTGLSLPAHAQDVKALRYDLRLDIPLTSAAFAAWVGSELFKAELAPDRCRWCESQSFDEGARSRLRWSNTEAAYRTSNWLGFGLVPLGTAAGMALLASHAGAREGIGVDLLVIAQAAFLTAGLNQVVKYTVGRERPFVHALDAQNKPRTKHPADNNLSFYSAHASISFSVVVAAGTVATMRGYRGAPFIWAIGLPLAALTGYLRIAADRHYLSDVLVGTVVGSTVGFLAPFLMHSPRDSKGSGLSIGASANTVNLTFVQ